MIQSRSKPKYLCVDLDGTILDYESGWFIQNTYGQPLPGAGEGLQRLRECGFVIVVNTVRNDVNRIGDQLYRHKIPFDYINEDPRQFEGDRNPGKIGADIYLDDRAITFQGDWEKAVNDVLTFKNWKQSHED